jgi:hypothetical protein
MGGKGYECASVKVSSGLNRGMDANGHVETVGKVSRLIKRKVVPTLAP